MDALFADLAARGSIHQQTHAEALREHCAAGRRGVYCGFDPTASSLTVGNLVAILLLRRFQLAGHRPVVVMGGGTGLIGDPSGKEAERPMFSREQIEANIEGQRGIFERLLDRDGPAAVRIVNNLDWLGTLGFLEALRDLGKHFSVNAMIQRDSVRDRLEQREQGISYTEFSYMLLQAYDFLHLFDHEGVTVQVAGSDQWGNIVSGVELVRRLRRAEVFGLTAPLITRADGGKFGKTESGAIWLTPERTSPYAFYQFWLNTSDADVERYLCTFSLRPHAEVRALATEHERDPAQRLAQRALAAEVTALLHGPEGLEQARVASEALFSGDLRGLSAALLDEVFAHVPSATFSRERLQGEGVSLVELLVEAGVATSKRQARELLSSGAISVNGERADAEARLRSEALLHGKVALVRRGKKAWHLTRWE